ncbi:MAG: low molecular weight protein-tyrosine-phosphatase [Nakamurella sp.]
MQQLPESASYTATAVPFQVLVVCSGNICRSPMGEKVLQRAFTDAGLSERVTVSSAGTGNWHVGQGAHEPAERVLAAASYPTVHTVRQVTAEMVDAAGLVLAADHGHYRTLRAMAADPTHVQMLRSFDPDADAEDVPDPYGHSDAAYREVLAMLEAAAPGIVDAVKAQLI